MMLCRLSRNWRKNYRVKNMTEEVAVKAENLQRRLERLLSDYRAIHEEFRRLEEEGVALGDKIRHAVDDMKMQKVKEHINQLNEN